MSLVHKIVSPSGLPLAKAMAFYLLALPLMALLSGCGSRNTASIARRRVPAQNVSKKSANEYVGSEACAECHASEFKAQSRSRHWNALRPMDLESLGAQSPPVGPIHGTPFSLALAGDGFAFGFTGGEMHRLDLAFGSGKTAMAFTTVLDNDTMAEARFNYDPRSKRWFITPGDTGLPPDRLGITSKGAAARDCFPCHTVTTSLHSLMPEPRFMGVRCEACHGPGGAHVAAMSTGDLRHSHMADLSAASAEQIVALCGRCHHTNRDVAAKHFSKAHTDFFQALGIQESQCYLKTSNRLSCITCHDPHTDVNTDEKHYTPICLQCHSAAAHPGAVAQGKSCPVSPMKNCTGCHMPARAEPLYPGSTRTMADHFIRVYPQDIESFSLSEHSPAASNRKRH